MKQAVSMEEKMELKIEQIMKILPHRYPFLLVDRVIDYSDEKITAIKNVSVNEPFFCGHYPQYPIMPGVLLIEGLAQTAGILILKNMDSKNISPLFLGIDRARFKKEVRPGDTIMYEVQIIQRRSSVIKVKGNVSCGKNICATAELMLGMKQDGGKEE
jgi:3-hydroxyacyl-[acyl-carrier-protein] dehydratase